MKSDWQIKKLSDIVEFNPTERLPKGAIAKKIPMDILQPFTKDIFQYELQPYNGGAKFRNGDTIMARITPCLENGKVSKVNILTQGEVGFGSTEYIVLRAIPNVSDPDFIYYLTISDFVRAPAIKSMVGSSGRQRVQQNVLETLKLPLPPYDEQKKIAAILSALDEKIAINRAINDNLEQQALSIFYNLFAGSDDSMETELGYIPRTFSVTKVGQLPMIVTDYVANGSFASLKENVNLYQEPNFAYFIRNTDLKADSFGVYVDKHSYEFLSKSTLFGGEIIISNVGDVGSVHLCPVLDRPMTLGNNIIMLRPNEELRYYLYIWFKYAQGQSLIQGIKGGSAQPKFNKTDFKSLPIAIPNDAILCSFSSVVSPMFALINSNKMENNRLIKIRDSILPCLMTGEIDVSEVEL